MLFFISICSSQQQQKLTIKSPPFPAPGSLLLKTVKPYEINLLILISFQISRFIIPLYKLPFKTKLNRYVRVIHVFLLMKY